MANARQFMAARTALWWKPGGPAPEYDGPLTFTAEEPNASVQLTAVGTAPAVTLLTSVNGGSTWTTYTVGDVISLASVGDTVMFKADAGGNAAMATSTSVYHKFVLVGRIAASGNANSLLDEDFESVLDLTAAPYCFAGLFSSCATLTSTPKFTATATGLSCYYGAFRACSQITKADFPLMPAVGSNAFNGCTSLASVSFPACTRIGSSAFSGCTSLSVASFPACTSIGGSAFNGCTSLSVASFPACTSIGSTAFSGCTSLSVASFPACTSIGSTAFYNCTSLKVVSFPACTSIGGTVYTNSPFNGCSAIEEMYFDSYRGLLRSYWFSAAKSTLRIASFPVCSSIGMDALASCTALSIASFPACITVSTRAFNNCTSLSVVSLPACTTISGGVFAHCPAITMVYIGAYSGPVTQWFSAAKSTLRIVSFPACETIGGSTVLAFNSYTALTVASFPACTKIYEQAFRGCTSLISLFFRASNMEGIHSNVFSSTNSTFRICVPTSLVTYYQTLPGWSDFASQIEAFDDWED